MTVARSARLGVCLVLALTGTPLAAQEKLPAVASVATAAKAGDLLRDLFVKAEYYDGIALGDSLSRKFPRDSRVRAWYIGNLATSGFSVAADSLTKRIDSTSRDPWLLVARAFARHNAPVPSNSAAAEGIRLLRRAHRLAPRENDFIWLTAQHMLFIPGYPTHGGGPALAYIDSVAPNSKEPEILVARAVAFSLLKAGDFAPNKAPDTATENTTLRILHDVRTRDSAVYSAAIQSATRLRTKDEAQALALAKRAVEIAPRSPNARYLLWGMIESQRGPSAEKHAAVAADRARFLAVTDSAPWAMEESLGMMRSMTKEPTVQLEDRILAKAPRSRSAEQVLLGRANQWRDSLYAARDTARPGPKSDTAVMRARYLAAVEGFINKPWTADPALRTQAISTLFFEVRADTTYPADKLVRLAHQVVDAKALYRPGYRYGEVSRALSNRKLEVAYTEQLAKEGLKHTSGYLNDMPGYFFSSVGDKAQTLDVENSGLYQNLGWSYFAAGKTKDAEREVAHALELNKKDANIYYDLGRIQAADGRADEAELTFAQGMTIRVRGVNPNRAELSRLYERRNGSIDGWEKYVASLEEKERSTRRDRILAKRDSQPQPVPGFRLADLAGKTVRSDSLQAKTIIVNFWGTWCGPCVAEMPELQAFYDKYRNDPSVAIFTISNDKDLNELRDWMAKRKLTIPTLFDNGYVGKAAQITTFPTTWFIDNSGKIQFKAVGNTGALVEEWTWRLEATKKGTVIQP